jgi:hypothetical protein
MFNTVETRWFGRGDTPDNLLAWFARRAGDAEQQPLRRDYYLQRIRDMGLNVKLREGGLEVKQRQRSHGLIQLGQSVEGVVERWTKWRFPVPESSDSIQSIQEASRSWLAVEKRRQLRHYRVDETGSVLPVSPLNVMSATCHFELAVVWAGESRWWTLAFEIDDQGSDALERLLAVAARQFDKRPPIHLSESNSFGYPHWLAKSLN